MASQTEREQVGRRAAILERALVEARVALRRQAQRHSRGESEAEEAIQEASVDFLRTYNGPPGVDAVRWLQVAIKRRAWELGRKERGQLTRATRARREGRDLEAAAGADPGEALERTESVAEFFSAFSQLKADERTALLLLGLGFSYKEICERQGWTWTKVNRCLAEGRAALRTMVDRT